LRQQERWVAGSMAEIKSALGHISLYEKYVSLPCILLLISLPGIMVLSALAYSITYYLAFLVLTAIAFLTMLFSSLRYLDVQDAVLSPIFSTAYGLIFLFTIAVVASKKLRGKEIKWYKTPR
jgi:E3 ubiquitin-protein ligase DOA10